MNRFMLQLHPQKWKNIAHVVDILDRILYQILANTHITHRQNLAHGHWMIPEESKCGSTATPCSDQCRVKTLAKKALRMQHLDHNTVVVVVVVVAAVVVVVVAVVVLDFSC